MKTKIKIAVIAMMGVSLGITAQTVLDSRNDASTPVLYNKEVKYEFKKRDVIAAPGTGGYTGLMTFAPWGDNSGGFHHQLTFNGGGVFYRNGLPDSETWNPWTRLLTEADLNNPTKVDVNDSRADNYAPNYYNKEVNFEFKARGSVGVPGAGSYSGLMTFAPWGDNSGGHHHQLNFNQGGIFYRIGLADSDTWDSWVKVLTENTEGNVGIGTADPGSWKLAVNGKIRAKEIKVETGWADFVFYDNYNLPTLEEVENHIKEKGHLKDIPSAKEVEENGIYLGEMDSKLLQKIEELTLYTIEQEKKIKAQEDRFEKQNSKIEKQAEEIKELKTLINKLIQLKS
ncbi:cell wall anchor protein [Tenacibaculum amylolyticum]|uniref:cell wall anchor protein n=1 Tax=Tenacibaculum amylolyticum TaxID=104269 RepID=UPI003893AC10